MEDGLVLEVFIGDDSREILLHVLKPGTRFNVTYIVSECLADDDAYKKYILKNVE